MIYLMPFLKILGGILSACMTAAVKVSKDVKRYDNNLQHINEIINPATNPIGYRRARQTYGDDAELWMNMNKPKKVKFWDELITNIHRPLFILYWITLLAQLTLPVAIMAALLSLLFYFIEQHIETWKEKPLYNVLIIIAWIITYPILIWSECIYRCANQLP